MFIQPLPNPNRVHHLSILFVFINLIQLTCKQLLVCKLNFLYWLSFLSCQSFSGIHINQPLTILNLIQKLSHHGRNLIASMCRLRLLEQLSKFFQRNLKFLVALM
jgi:hypothetical protein